MDAAANIEVPSYGHGLRLTGAYEVVENAIDHVLVERPLIAERPEIKLQRFELDA